MMAKWVLSAFADEADGTLAGQISALKQEGCSMLELRGVNGKNCADLTLAEAAEIRQILADNGLGLSALGSPYGKTPIDQPFTSAFDAFRHGLDLCDRLNCRRIRMFSFYLPAGDAPEKWREEVLRRLVLMLDEAEAAGVTLTHENEKGIYGDTAARCQDLLESAGPRLGCVFDPANFIQCGERPLEAFDLLANRVTYLHVKDALSADGAVVTAGSGDGQLVEILRRLKERPGEVILTVEPHLRVFSGLNKLQSEPLTHHQAYPDSRSAFHAACGALRALLDQVDKEEA